MEVLGLNTTILMNQLENEAVVLVTCICIKIMLRIVYLLLY